MLYNCVDYPGHLGNAVLYPLILSEARVKGCARHWNKGFGIHKIVSSDWGDGLVGEDHSGSIGFESLVPV